MRGRAGIDEAGRGAWAGPVVAACVLFRTRDIPLVADSKILSAKERERLFDEIMKAAYVGIGARSHEYIDAHGIRKATHHAMQEALDNMPHQPKKLAIDGRDGFHFDLPHQYIIRGDMTEAEISAASIIAKVSRDKMMVDFHDIYPMYGFKDHKGYGTHVHQTALSMYGPCDIHRTSYKPISLLLQNRNSE